MKQIKIFRDYQDRAENSCNKWLEENNINAQQIFTAYSDVHSLVIITVLYEVDKKQKLLLEEKLKKPIPLETQILKEGANPSKKQTKTKKFKD